MSSSAPQRFAFVFPLASGHINPSLPMARSLVAAGHEVHYLCREQMRDAIEDAGATFHSEIEHEPELYVGRTPDVRGASESLKREHGLEGDSFIETRCKLAAVSLELTLPGVIRWLRDVVRPCAVCYCPLSSSEAALASHVLGIPSVALLTTAGAGSIPAAFEHFLAQGKSSVDSLRYAMETFEPHREAVGRLNSKYSLGLGHLMYMEPLGKLDMLKYSVATLVTTCEMLQDPTSPEVAEAYARDGVRFEAVGPLLDQQGARRAAGHKLNDAPAEGGHEAGHSDADGGEVLQRVTAARAVGRSVVLVSMGTVITGDSPQVGWESRPMGADGQQRGLAGRELCRAAWGGAFDALGADSAEEGPLLIVALGPQKAALGEVVPPANALCFATVPQVDILREGVAAFLTHGGQNSFTEGLANAAPLVVCSGFGDQPVNARKAAAFGVGLQVPRPDCEEGGEAAAAAQYRCDVAGALRRVVAEAGFRDAAAVCAEQLRKAGGVPRAVEAMLAAGGVASRPQPRPEFNKVHATTATASAVEASAPCGGA